MEVYCNDGETCVSNIAREINEHGGYYYVYLVKIKVSAKTLMVNLTMRLVLKELI